MDLIPVYRTTHLTEAAVMKSKLEADGLHPFVKNYEHAQMSQIDILALGGMTIMVPENEAERAHEILTDQSEEFIDTNVFDNYEPPLSIQNQKPYKANIVPIMLLLVAALLIIIFTRLDVLSLILIGMALFLYHAQKKATEIQSKKQG